MSDESGFNMKKFLCLMKCPCTMCCGLAYMSSAMENPPDAEKLSEDEAKTYVDQLQGTGYPYNFLKKNPCYLYFIYFV